MFLCESQLYIREDVLFIAAPPEPEEGKRRETANHSYTIQPE